MISSEKTKRKVSIPSTVQSSSASTGLCLLGNQTGQSGAGALQMEITAFCGALVRIS